MLLIPQVDLADRVMAHWAFDAGAELAERLHELRPAGKLLDRRAAMQCLQNRLGAGVAA